VARITDGLSNTLLISEAAARPQSWRNGVRVMPDPTFMNGAWGHSGNDIAVDGSNAAGSTLSAAADVPSACRINCSNQGEIYSFHAGGAFACFGDGSVRFLSVGMSLINLQRLCARADGGTVELP
jgi:hypothetical protein